MLTLPTEPITVKEAVERKIFPFSERTLFRRVKDGTIPTIIDGKTHKITPEAIDAFFRKSEGGITIASVFDELEAFVDIATNSPQLATKYRNFLARARKHFSS